MKSIQPLLMFCACCASAPLASADLIGFYSFDDDAAPLTDDSGGGNTLQSVAADPTYVADGGVEAGAYSFDGFQRLVAPININPAQVPELTMGAWVKTSNLETGLRKVMGHDDGGWDRTIGLDDRDNGVLRYTSFVGNGPPLQGTPQPTSMDDWTFLAAVYDQPNNQLSVYVDLDSSTTDDAPVVVTGPSGFGAGLETVSIGSLRPDTDAESWEGEIDNAFFFDEALDSGQIRQIRDGGKSAITGELPPSDPVINVAAGELFGLLQPQPGLQTRMINVVNDGTANTLMFTSVTVTGPDADLYAVTDAPDSLAPGASGEITVTFDPAGAIGDFTATLVIATNDFGRPEVTLDLFARVPQGAVSDTLLAFYHFDDPANPRADSSGRDNVLAEPAADATPTYTETGGIQGGAYSFDGGDRLIAPININPGEVPELTVGAWVKTASLEPGLRKVLGHDNGGWDRTIGLDDRDNNMFRYTSFIGDGPPLQGTPAPESTEAWTFLAVSYDQPNNEVTVYVDTDVSTLDDDLVVVSGPTGFGDGEPTLAIGGLSPVNANEGWLGEIDNVFLALGVLSEEQIDAFRAGGRTAIEFFGFGPPRENLVGFWPFDNPESPLADASGNDNTLDDSAAAPTYVPSGGVEGGAFDFTGQQRLIADIDVNTDQIPEMTWGAWVKPSNLTPGLKKVMGHDDGGWDRTIGLDNREDVFRYTSFSGSHPVVGTPGPVNTDDWAFLAAVYDEPNGDVTVYVDIDAESTEDALVEVTEPSSFGAGFPTFSIGSLRPDNNSEGWVGLLDNAFVYDTTLTATQLSFMRDRGSAAILGLTGDDPDLLLVRDPLFGQLASRDPVTRSIPIQNGGRSQPLMISAATIIGPDASFYTIDAFPASLAPGAGGTIDITFDPQNQVGNFAAQLELESNDTGQPIIVFNLPATTPAPDPLDPILEGPLISPFGVLTPGMHERTIEIENTGTTNDLIITDSSVVGSDATYYTVGDLPGPIAPGGSGEITVTFDSAGDFNNFSAALRITSNNASGRFSQFDISTVVPVPNPEDALFAYYSFDDPANPLQDDVPERGGDTVLTIPDVEPVYMPTGGFEESGAYFFDGSQRLVAEIDINPAEMPELTMGAWVKPDNLDSALKKLIGHDDGGYDRTIGLDNREGNFRYAAFTGTGVSAGTPEPVNTEDWTFMAVTFDESNDEVTVYVDLDASTFDDDPVAVTVPTAFGPGQPTLSIGSLRPDTNSEGWVGLIDRVFFFDSVLDSESIREIRDGGILPGGEDPNVRLRGGFGDLGINPGVVTREIMVQNSGKEQTLMITDTRLTGPDASLYTLNNTLPATLDPGASATLEITLDPGVREGGFVAFLEIDSNDAGDPTETLDLSALIPNANGLLAHYRLDEESGTAMLDASGNGAHGSYLTNNGGAFTLGQEALASGTAVSFDDAGDTGAGFGQVPSGADIPELTNFSVSMWFNQDPGDTGVSTLFAKGTGTGDPFAVAVIEGTLVWFSAGSEGPIFEGAITPGETTHLVTTFETVEGQPTVTFYVNGEEVGSQAGVAPFDDSNPSIFQIGTLNGSFGFTGLIDDVQLYGRPLNLEDATFLFENPGEDLPGEVGPEPPSDFRIQSITRTTDGNVTLTWPVAQDADYQVEFSTTLETWSVIDDINFTVDANTATLLDTNAARTDAEEGYYRVALLP